MFLTFGRSFEGQDKVKGQKESRIWNLIFKTINYKKTVCCHEKWEVGECISIVRGGRKGSKKCGWWENRVKKMWEMSSPDLPHYFRCKQTAVQPDHLLSRIGMCTVKECIRFTNCGLRCYQLICIKPDPSLGELSNTH